MVTLKQVQGQLVSGVSVVGAGLSGSVAWGGVRWTSGPVRPGGTVLVTESRWVCCLPAGGHREGVGLGEGAM